MKAFELHRLVVESFAAFTRSFASPRAVDIKVSVNGEYPADRVRPDALLPLDPDFARAANADAVAQGYILPEELRPTVARCTGQKDGVQRLAAAESPANILLTNLKTLELLLTRQNRQNPTIIADAQGQRPTFLDEPRTRRSRQRADLAMRVPSLSDQTQGAKRPPCAGTSAAMANEVEVVPTPWN